MGEPHRFPPGEERDPAKLCTARKSGGEPCLRYRMKGQKVCGRHGGRAPQALAKARQRLEEAADRLAKELLGIAIDPDADPNTKLKAIGMALDRAGVTAKQTIAIGPDANAPWRDVLDSLVVARTTPDGRPLPPQPALPGPRNQLPPPMIEGEVVESPYTSKDYDNALPEAPLVGGNAAEAAEQPPREQPPVGRESTAPVVPQRTGLVSLEDALDRQAQQIRRPPR